MDPRTLACNALYEHLHPKDTGWSVIMYPYIIHGLFMCNREVILDDKYIYWFFFLHQECFRIEYYNSYDSTRKLIKYV